MSLTIPCPKCLKPTRVRTSERLSNRTIKAILYCPTCLNVKAHFMGEIVKIEYAVFQEEDPDKIEPKLAPKAPSQLDLLNKTYLK